MATSLPSTPVPLRPIPHRLPLGTAATTSNLPSENLKLDDERGSMWYVAPDAQVSEPIFRLSFECLAYIVKGSR